MTPLLRRLADSEVDAWEEVFRRTYPSAFEAARLRLGDVLRSECEDVAVEALVRVSAKIGELKSEDELKPLAVAIARNIATDKLRKRFAEKRGSNKVESLDALIDADDHRSAGFVKTDILDELAVKELGELLAELSCEVKKEYRTVLRDYYLIELSHKEIAEKRRIAVGSVGVYIQRGLSALRSAISRRPTLEKEFLEMLGDSRALRILLPLISAIQLGGWFFRHAEPGAFRSGARNRDEVSDEDRLRFGDEDLPDAAELNENKTVQLVSHVCQQRHPARYAAWIKHRQELEAKEQEGCEAFEIRWRKTVRTRRLILLVVALAIAAAVTYALLR